MHFCVCFIIFELYKLNLYFNIFILYKLIIF
nr:MAG TPA: hypothetical protein [Bacteriophage sp.]